MTGIIVALTGAGRKGTIRLEDGSYMVFAATAVLGDFEALVVGDRVSFDAERDPMHNTAVRVFREPFGPGASSGKHAGGPDLRYAGFDQADNVRSYRFDAVSPGGSVRYCVTVDVGLFLKHRVGVQEAPALCLRKLATDLKSALDSGRHQLRDDDLKEFASSRAVNSQRKKPRHLPGSRRGAPPPAPSQGGGAH
jgi:cold shock CspA family protein